MLLKYTAYVSWLNSCQSGKNLKVKNKTHHRIRELRFICSSFYFTHLVLFLYYITFCLSINYVCKLECERLDMRYLTFL